MASNYDLEIKRAMLSSNPWSSRHASGFKKYIKSLIQKEQEYYCCYCLRDIRSESERVKHIEHILPKSKFPAYTFDIKNLAISCVRCNSDIKLDDTEFLTCNLDIYKERWSNTVYKSTNYRFIHPKLDEIKEHLHRETRVKEDRVYYFYKTLSEKGEYHYEYFKLSYYSKEYISEVQGVKTESNASESRIIINNLFKKNKETNCH